MKSILVIEDNKDLRENTAEILDLAGYKTSTAENGKKGGRPENPKEPKESQITQALNNKPKKAVIDNVIDNVSTIQNIDIDFDLQLPEMKINNAIEYLSRTRKTEADRDLVLTLWTAFKEKNFTGEKFYKSEAKIFGHFFETLKFEKINGTHQQKPGTSAARVDALKKW